MSTDIGETLERLRFNGLTVPLFSPADGDFLLGDANNGATVPQGGTVSVHQHAGSVTDSLTVTLRNVTRDTSTDVAFDASTYDRQTADLYFGPGDEIAVEVNGTTDASNGYLLVEHETDSKAMGLGES